MKGDKKKVIVVAALALVIVGVGVFQFVASSSPAPAPAATAKKEDKKPVKDQEKVDPPKNPTLLASLPARDPFTATVSLTQTDPNQPKAPTPVPPKSDPEPSVPRMPPAQIGGPGFGAGTGPMTIQALPEAKFAFSLSGVMLGAKPMAVFRDAQGNQRLILLGGSLDPDSSVTSIEKDTVTVRFHGKTLRLTVEGNPNAK